MHPLFTIGHSNHALDHFLGLLRAHGVDAIVDVRSAPHSKFAPHFSKRRLEAALNEAGAAYRFLGKELGARRDEQECYVDGQAQYERIAQLPIFREGLERVIAETRQRRAALMCAEADPIQCHRAILVCRELLRREPELDIVHILRGGGTETHEELEARLIDLHNVQPELFDDAVTPDALTGKAYAMQAESIAYKRKPE